MHKAEIAVVALEVVTVLGVLLAITRSHAFDVVWSALLVAASVIWLHLNGPLEGRVLWKLDNSHGLTSGDLLAVPALTLAVCLTLRYAASFRRRNLSGPKPWA